MAAARISFPSNVGARIPAGISKAPPDQQLRQDQSWAMNQLTSLMERLRNKSHGQQTWVDVAKNLQQSAMYDKQSQTSLDTSPLRAHIDNLLKAVKATSLPYVLDRLEGIGRQVKLKFGIDQSRADVCFSSDMFYVRLLLDSGGGIKDVLISHGTDSKSCPELTQSLKEGRLEILKQHLEGLIAVYDIEGDKKQRSRAHLALESMEKDLCTLSKLQSSIPSVSGYIHTSPLGVVIPRVVGLPMKLTYFLAPYDLLNHKTKSATPMTLEAIKENGIGQSLTVGLEASSMHKLQIMSLLTAGKVHDGLKLGQNAQFTSLNNVNSMMLPARFVLRFNRPIIITASIINKIQNATGLEILEPGVVLMSMSKLLVDQLCSRRRRRKGTATNNNIVDNGRQHNEWDSHAIITLPNQYHQFYLGGCGGEGGSGLNGCSLQGALVSKIPFTHPSSVPPIIALVRQQVLFNCVMISCLRSSAHTPTTNSNSTSTNNRQQQSRNGIWKGFTDRLLTFELTPLSLHCITVTCEHPYRDSLITVEFDLTDVTSVKCRMFSSSSGGGGGGKMEDIGLCPDEYATRILQRSLSLPVTLRSILRKASVLAHRHLPIPPPLPLLPAAPRRIPTSHRPGVQRRPPSSLLPPTTTASLSIPTSSSSLYLPVEANNSRARAKQATVKLSKSDMACANMAGARGVVDTVTKQNKLLNNPMLASLLDSAELSGQASAGTKPTPSPAIMDTGGQVAYSGSNIQQRKRSLEDGGSATPPAKRGVMSVKEENVLCMANERRLSSSGGAGDNERVDRIGNTIGMQKQETKYAPVPTSGGVPIKQEFMGVGLGVGGGGRGGIIKQEPFIPAAIKQNVGRLRADIAMVQQLSVHGTLPAGFGVGPTSGPALRRDSPKLQNMPRPVNPAMANQGGLTHPVGANQFATGRGTGTGTLATVGGMRLQRSESMSSYQTPNMSGDARFPNIRRQSSSLSDSGSAGDVPSLAVRIRPTGPQTASQMITVKMEPESELGGFVGGNKTMSSSSMVSSSASSATAIVAVARGNSAGGTMFVKPGGFNSNNNAGGGIYPPNVGVGTDVMPPDQKFTLGGGVGKGGFLVTAGGPGRGDVGAKMGGSISSSSSLKKMEEMSSSCDNLAEQKLVKQEVLIDLSDDSNSSPRMEGKPPLTMKLKKPRSVQNRNSPQTSNAGGASDNLNASDLSADSEVDRLTASGAIGEGRGAGGVGRGESDSSSKATPPVGGTSPRLGSSAMSGGSVKRPIDSMARPAVPGGGGEKKRKTEGAIGGMTTPPVDKKPKRDDSDAEAAARKLVKKQQKVYEFDEDNDGGGGGSSGMVGHKVGGGKIGTIKITSSNGRLQIQNSGSSGGGGSGGVGGVMRPKISSLQRMRSVGAVATTAGSVEGMAGGTASTVTGGSLGHVAGRSLHKSPLKIGSAGSLLNRSIGSSGVSIGMNRARPDGGSTPRLSEMKQLKTAAIKVKPITLPITAAATASGGTVGAGTGSAAVPASVSATGISSAVTPPFNTTVKLSQLPPSTGGVVKVKMSASTGGALTTGASTPGPIKQRKLSDVIDKLNKQQHVGSTAPSAASASGTVTSQESSAGGVISQKEKYDAIRLKTVRDGNKPCMPLTSITIPLKSSVSSTTLVAAVSSASATEGATTTTTASATTVSGSSGQNLTKKTLEVNLSKSIAADTSVAQKKPADVLSTLTTSKPGNEGQNIGSAGIKRPDGNGSKLTVTSDNVAGAATSQTGFNMKSTPVVEGAGNRSVDSSKSSIEMSSNSTNISAQNVSRKSSSPFELLSAMKSANSSELSGLGRPSSVTPQFSRPNRPPVSTAGAMPSLSTTSAVRFSAGPASPPLSESLGSSTSSPIIVGDSGPEPRVTLASAIRLQQSGYIDGSGNKQFSPAHVRAPSVKPIISLVRPPFQRPSRPVSPYVSPQQASFYNRPHVTVPTSSPTVSPSSAPPASIKLLQQNLQSRTASPLDERHFMDVVVPTAKVLSSTATALQEPPASIDRHLSPPRSPSPVREIESPPPAGDGICGDNDGLRGDGTLKIIDFSVDENTEREPPKDESVMMEMASRASKEDREGSIDRGGNIDRGGAGRVGGSVKDSSGRNIIIGGVDEQSRKSDIVTQSGKQSADITKTSNNDVTVKESEKIKNDANAPSAGSVKRQAASPLIFQTASGKNSPIIIEMAVEPSSEVEVSHGPGDQDGKTENGLRMTTVVDVEPISREPEEAINVSSEESVRPPVEQPGKPVNVEQLRTSSSTIQRIQEQRQQLSALEKSSAESSVSSSVEKLSSRSSDGRMSPSENNSASSSSLSSGRRGSISQLSSVDKPSAFSIVTSTSATATAADRNLPLDSRVIDIGKLSESRAVRTASPLVMASSSPQTSSKTVGEASGCDDKENSAVFESAAKGSLPPFKAPILRPSSTDEFKAIRASPSPVGSSKMASSTSSLRLIPSPHSEPSSPDDSLVIDMTVITSNPTNRGSGVVISTPGSKSGPWSPAGASLGVSSDIIMAMSPKMMSSPSSSGVGGGVKSPMTQRNSQQTSPQSVNSTSCEIDDDLMNEALML